MSKKIGGYICGLMPYEYVHVVDLISNITRLEIGPQTLMLKTNEDLVLGPLLMIVVPPGHYTSISNPVSSYEAGKACEVKFGQREIRLHQEPFPLYPGESLTDAPDYIKNESSFQKSIKALPVIHANHAVKLKAIVDMKDNEGIERQAGEMWHLRGPLTYIPTADCKIIRIVSPVIIKRGDAIRLRATQDVKDNNGRNRVCGEEWLISKPGAYVPDVYEEVLGVETEITLTSDTGLHLQATQTTNDYSGSVRVAGEEWLLTGDETASYSPQVGVEVMTHVSKTVLGKGQYCTVIDPIDEKKQPQLGKRMLRKGHCTFFLHPGEKLAKGVENSHLLSADESLILQAVIAFKDEMFKETLRRPGDRWMIRGPVDYIPPIEVNIIKKRQTIPLSKNEGIYVQNQKTGKIRSVMGPCSYMLTAHEELWEKQLSSEMEEILRNGGGIGDGDIRKLAYYEQSINPDICKGRIKTNVVMYRCPGNTAVQVYNFMMKTSRVILGPDLIVLGPDESFNILSLSAGKPKRANALKTICLMLGPDFITDILEVETSDHARLRIKVSLNNHFVYDKKDISSLNKMFSVPDFIGFACRQIGGRIRAAVAMVPFDDFHRHSVQIIHTSVFGQSDSGKLLRTVQFDVNNLVITNIDIQSIEPSDPKMRDSLGKSVQMAIEISTNSVEAAATHEAKRNEQAAQGHLERQKLANEKNAEKERTKLLQLCAITAAIESTGQAKAEAQAQAEKALIECHSEIEIARLKAEAEGIEHRAKLDAQNMVRRSEMNYQRGLNELLLKKEAADVQIQVERFKTMIDCMGQDKCTAMARSGPDIQIRLLQALGVSEVLLSDGKTPINLYSTADGFIKQSPT